MEGDDRHDVVLEAAGEHPPVVVERALRPFVVLGLDARPLEGEPVCAEPEVAQQSDVVGVAVEVIDGVARDIAARRFGPVLELPPVVVPVAALGLVRGSRGSPDETGREVDRHGRGDYRRLSA